MRFIEEEHVGASEKREESKHSYADYVEESSDPKYAPAADFNTIDQDINRTFGFDTEPMQQLRRKV